MFDPVQAGKVVKTGPPHLTSTTFVYVWSFEVKAGQEGWFENAYGTDGDWVRLFRLGEGYLSTELLKDWNRPGHYWTIDKWVDESSYEAFRKAFASEFKQLDRSCEQLTESEFFLGRFAGLQAQTRSDREAGH